MKSIRFSGLVRLATRVQRELATSVAVSKREELRTQVERAVAWVDRTLDEFGVGLRAVPGPTRRAYDFLRTIEFSQFPTTSNGVARETTRMVTLGGVVAQVQRLAERLASSASSPNCSYADLQRAVTEARNRADRAVLKLDATEQLTPHSRDHLGWLRFMSDTANLQRYRDAVSRAVTSFEVPAETDRWPRPIAVHFRPTRSVFRARVEDNRTRILLPTPMIALSSAQFSELALALFGRSHRLRDGALHAIQMAEAYQELRLQLESMSGIVEETRGMVHDLADSFNRVNGRYFAGQMQRPRLTWNRSITAGKFGHYHYATDTVMVSRSLDRHHVPAFVVDHVMHHELLHKKHGLRWQNGRSRAHTPEFRREERLFARYHEADRFLQSLARASTVH